MLFGDIRTEMAEHDIGKDFTCMAQYFSGLFQQIDSFGCNSVLLNKFM